MKNLKMWCTVLIISYLWSPCRGIIMTSSENNSSPTPLDTFIELLKNGKNIWWVGKVTQMKKLPDGIETPTINSCSARSHTANCEAVRYLLKLNNGIITSTTVAFDTSFDTIAAYFGTFEISKYLIQETVDHMQTLNRSGSHYDEPQIPALIFAVIAKKFEVLLVENEVVYISEKGGKKSWVLYSGDIVGFNQNKNPAFIAEVNKNCSQLGMKNLIDLVTTLPFVPNFIF